MTLKPIPIRAAAEEGGKRTAEILIYEPIGADFFGFGLDAKRFAEQLRALGQLDEIVVRINSPGGLVHDGLAIFNTLVAQQAKVVVHIDGLAASSASFVAQAASPGVLHMAENALMMIHEAWGMTVGAKGDHRKEAEVLEQHDGVIAATYARRSGRKPKEFLKLMAEETWMTAAEAKAEKLADVITPARKEAACFDPAVLNRFQKTPADLAARFQAAADDKRQEEEAARARDAQAQAQAQAAEAERVQVRLRLLQLENDFTDSDLTAAATAR